VNKQFRAQFRASALVTVHANGTIVGETTSVKPLFS
jgi:hypothetical protein